MSNFFKTFLDLNLSHLESLARMRVYLIRYSSITCEDDYHKLHHVYDVKWAAEHMTSHYCCAAYVERLTGKEFPEEKKERVIRAIKESEELSGPYLEKVKNRILPSHEESHALRQALCRPHSPVHIWCIESV
jgi:hypothetical protein